MHYWKLRATTYELGVLRLADSACAAPTYFSRLVGSLKNRRRFGSHFYDLRCTSQCACFGSTFVLTTGRELRASIVASNVTTSDMSSLNRNRCSARPESAPPYQKAFLLTRMGNLALSQGRAEESIRYYEQAVEADAVSLQPALFFAEFLAHQVGNYVAAIEKCDYIIERAAAYPFDEDDEEMSGAYYEAKALEIHAYCVSRLPAS